MAGIEPAWLATTVGRHETSARLKALFSAYFLWQRVESLLTYNRMVVDNELTQSEIDRLFQALSDATRRDIFRRTVEHGDSVSVLASRYSMSFAAVQKHVKVLERAALVTKERRGREQIVHANGATMRRASALLDGYEQLWIHRVEQIEEILETQEGEKA